MKILITLGLVFLAGVVSAQVKDTRYFELRVYYAAAGKLDALITRFNDHTTRIFEKHGMTNVGYWVPANNDKNTLYYILAYPDKDARKKSWDAFGADPEWKKVAEESQRNGKLVDSVKSTFMTSADVLSYPVEKASAGNGERIFELRTYHLFPGRFPNIVKRFKDHTARIFEKHGMQNIAYFQTDTPYLVYMIAHKSVEDAKKSWDAFRADPEWIKVKDDSEKDGKIVERVETIYLKPLSFSRIK